MRIQHDALEYCEIKPKGSRWHSVPSRYSVTRLVFSALPDLLGDEPGVVGPHKALETSKAPGAVGAEDWEQRRALPGGVLWNMACE